jgi:hypothetical protein
MGIRAILCAAALVWVAGSVLPVTAEEALPPEIGTGFPELIDAGVVEETDMAAGWMIVDGYRYRFTPDVPVQIGGSGASVGLVTAGMRLQIRYLRLPDGPRELLEAREIPPGVRVEGN